MSHLHNASEKVKSTMIYVRDGGEKKHFRVDGDFSHEDLRRIVADELPNARPGLMIVEHEVDKQEVA